MGRQLEHHKYKINRLQRSGKCRLIEDGKNCNKKVHCRGLCAKHHTRLLRHDLIGKYGNKTIFKFFDNNTYKVNKEHKKGQCHITESGKNCKRSLHGRGLCARHWLLFERHGVIDKFGGFSRKAPRTFTVKKRIPKGVCRISENGKGCQGDSKSRGMCSKHYLRILRAGLLKKFGKKA